MIHACRRAKVLWAALWLLAQPSGHTETPQAKILWTLKLPAVNTGSSPAQAPDGTLYFGLFDGTLMAVSSQGSIRWKFKSDSEIKSSPAIGDDGTIYFGSRDRKLYAVKPTGELKWSFPTDAWVDSSPAVAADGTLYFGSWDGNFYAIRPDGSLRWRVEVGAVIDSSPAIASDGTIYFGGHDGSLYALYPDGTLRWKFKTRGAIISSPAIGSDGLIYLNSLGGNLYALNPNGSLAWLCPTPGVRESSPVLNESQDICVGINQFVIVICSKGKSSWGTHSGYPIETAQLAVAGGFYITRPWFNFLGVKRESTNIWDAQVLWEAHLNANTTSSPILDSTGIVYVCAERGFYAIQPPGPVAPLSSSSWPMFHANTRHTGRVGAPSQMRQTPSERN